MTELFVATWSIRLAMVGALVVGGLSVSVGAGPLEAQVKAAAVAFAFTLGGRLLLGRLETPEHRARRYMARRNARRSSTRSNRKPAEKEAA